MKIAIPVADGKLCAHFGHCAYFALINVDAEKKTILSQETVEPPPHEPGLLPRWLGEKRVDVVIAGGMGKHAQRLFAEFYITVLVGAPQASVEVLVDDYLNDKLETGINLCDH